MSRLDFILMMVMNFIYGSSFAIGALGMQYFSPFFLYFLRFFISGTISICFNKFPSKDIKLIFLSSIFTTLCFLGLALGIKYTDSSTASIIVRLDTIFTIILSALFFKENITYKIIISIILCLIGLLLIKGGISTSYYIIILVSVAFFSSMVDICTKKIHNSTNQQITAWTSFFTSIFLCIASLITEKTYILKPIDFKSILIILYFSIFSTYISYYILYSLLRKYPASKIVPYHFSRIIIALFLGIFLKELYTYKKIIGIVLIILGIYISQKNISIFNKK